MNKRLLEHAPVVPAVDVDGVLLDPSRSGSGSWQSTLPDRFGITPDTLHEAFFARWWPDVVTGREPIGPWLEAALAELGQAVWCTNDADWRGEVDAALASHLRAQR